MLNRFGLPRSAPRRYGFVLNFPGRRKLLMKGKR
jgi:hypothetical protein